MDTRATSQSREAWRRYEVRSRGPTAVGRRFAPWPQRGARLDGSCCCLSKPSDTRYERLARLRPRRIDRGRCLQLDRILVVSVASPAVLLGAVPHGEDVPARVLEADVSRSDARPATTAKASSVASMVSDTSESLAPPEPHADTDAVAAHVANALRRLAAKGADDGQKSRLDKTSMIREAASQPFRDPALVDETMSIWRTGSGAAHGFQWLLLGQANTRQAGRSDEQGIAAFHAAGGIGRIANPYMCAFHLARHGWQLLDQRVGLSQPLQEKGVSATSPATWACGAAAARRTRPAGSRAAGGRGVRGHRRSPVFGSLAPPVDVFHGRSPHPCCGSSSSHGCAASGRRGRRRSQA